MLYLVRCVTWYLQCRLSISRSALIPLPDGDAEEQRACVASAPVHASLRALFDGDDQQWGDWLMEECALEDEQGDEFLGPVPCVPVFPLPVFDQDEISWTLPPGLRFLLPHAALE